MWRVLLEWDCKVIQTDLSSLVLKNFKKFFWIFRCWIAFLTCFYFRQNDNRFQKIHWNLLELLCIWKKEKKKKKVCWGGGKPEHILWVRVGISPEGSYPSHCPFLLPRIFFFFFFSCKERKNTFYILGPKGWESL